MPFYSFANWEGRREGEREGGEEKDRENRRKHQLMDLLRVDSDSRPQWWCSGCVVVVVAN